MTDTNGRRFTTTSRLRLSPTSGDDYTEYSCQAKHKALQPDMPMRATVQLSVLCKYCTCLHNFALIAFTILNHSVQARVRCVNYR